MTVELGLQTGQVYVLKQEIEPNTGGSKVLITFGTSSYISAGESYPDLDAVTRHLVWRANLGGLSYYPDTLPNLSGITEPSPINLQNYVLYEVES